MSRCNLHKSVYIDNDGWIIDGFRPFWQRRLVSLLDYERERQECIDVLDEEYFISNRRKN